MQSQYRTHHGDFQCYDSFRDCLVESYWFTTNNVASFCSELNPRLGEKETIVRDTRLVVVRESDTQIERERERTKMTTPEVK